MKKIFVTRKIEPSGLELLEKHHEVYLQEENRPCNREELLEAASWADALLVMLSDSIDKELMHHAPRLKAVANYAVGYDNIDLASASRRGIGISNTPDVLTDATAEMAWALLFALARRVISGDQLVRNGRWRGWAPMQLLGADISGKTLGIIGAGRIGTAMARMSRGFRMKLLYCNRSRSQGMEALGAERCSLDRLLAESDVVSLHLPLNDASRHLINKDALKQMKENALLVNTARGAVIDEAALIEALRNGEIAGAALDVYEYEPALTEGLSALDNVVLTPHLGSASIGARAAMSTMAAENLLAMLDGRPGDQCLNSDIYSHS